MSGQVRLGHWGPRAVALGALLIVPGALLASFHCDEANVFRHVSQFARGDFADPGRPGLLWLLLTPSLMLDSPAASALAMRLAALGASAATLWLVWQLTLRAADAASAGAAVLLLATSMSWQAHSFEVRTDTFVLPLTLAVMLLLWQSRTRLGAAVLIGLLIAAAGLVSQKSIYNAAAIGMGWVVLVALRQMPRRFGVPLVASGVALACVAAWYGFLVQQGEGSDVVGTNLQRAASNAFDDPRSLKTNLRAWGQAARRAPVLYVALIPGVWLAWTRRRSNGQLLAVAAASLVMASTVFVHRGFFLYFIASFEPYLAVIAGAGLVAGVRRLPGGRRIRLAVVVVLVSIALGASAPAYRDMLEASNAAQLRLMREIQDAFPQPTPFWDGIGLVPGYPETTLFLTGTTRERLRAQRGPAALVQLARERKPLFFVRDYMTRERYLEPAERLWLWTHYVPYRSNLYLRGGRVRVRAGERRSATVEVVEAGTYTVHFWGGWSGAASVNGRSVRHGEEIDLLAGEATLVAEAKRGGGQLWLILGGARVPYAETIDSVVDQSLYPTLSRKRFQHYDKPGRDADLLTQASDPLLSRLEPKERRRRRRKHGTWQQMHDARMAAAQSSAPEPPIIPPVPTDRTPR